MSESLFDYKEDNLKSYPVYNYDENMDKRKKEINKYLEQWNLNYEILNEGEEEELRRYYLDRVNRLIQISPDWWTRQDLDEFTFLQRCLSELEL